MTDNPRGTVWRALRRDAFPIAEAAFTQAWVEGYVKSEKVGDGVSGLLGAEKADDTTTMRRVAAGASLIR